MSINAAPKSNKNAQVISFPTSALSPDQHRAIEYLMLGHTLIEISAKLRIDRKTLYQWRKNPIFQAEYNRKQAESLEVSNQRLRRLSEKAVAIIEKNLDDGNLQAALHLLKLVNALPPPDVETDPRVLLKRDTEKTMLAHWHGSPFAERQFGYYTLENKAFLGLTKDIYDHQARKYRLTEGPVDEIIEEIQQQEG